MSKKAHECFWVYINNPLKHMYQWLWSNKTVISCKIQLVTVSAICKQSALINSKHGSMSTQKGFTI